MEYLSSAPFDETGGDSASIRRYLGLFDEGTLTEGLFLLVDVLNPHFLSDMEMNELTGREYTIAKILIELGADPEMRNSQFLLAEEMASDREGNLSPLGNYIRSIRLKMRQKLPGRRYDRGGEVQPLRSSRKYQEDWANREYYNLGGYDDEEMV